MTKALSGKYKPFDPTVKYESKADEEASRVIWSTKSISLARKALDEGLKVAMDPFYQNNTLILKPNLLFRRTKDEEKEWIRCKLDIIYFAEKYCQLMTDSGDYEHITLREYQVKQLVMMQRHDKTIVLGSRQVGKTVITSIFLLWMSIFHKNISIAALGDKIATAVENLNKVKEILYRLPNFIKPGIQSWNVRSIVFDNRSKIFTGSAKKDSIVGKTCNVLFLDELAIPNAKQSKELVDFAFPVVETMINSGRGKIICTSTPNGENVFKELWNGAIYEENDFAHLEIPWHLIPGRTLKWREEKIKILGIDGFNEQYNCRFLSSNKCIFNDLTIKRISENSEKFIPFVSDINEISKVLHRVSRRAPSTMKEPIDFFRIKSGYDLEEFKNPHVITVDIAEGILQDYTVFNIWKPIYRKDLEDRNEESFNKSLGQDGIFEEDSFSAMFASDNCAEFVDFEQVAIFHSNEICIRTAALFLRVITNKLFNKETLRISIELNKYGGQFLDLLLNQNSYPEYEIDQETLGYIQVGEEDPKFGVMLSSKTKKLYVRQCKTDIETGRFKLQDSMSIEECKDFGQNPNGTFSASSGSHDDIFMTNVNLSAWASPDNSGYVTWVEEYIVNGYEEDLMDDDDFFYDY